ncbi:hypothetical protein GEMRC1_002509 [Eukaryota sp. GEM-RC1]
MLLGPLLRPLILFLLNFILPKTHFFSLRSLRLGLLSGCLKCSDIHIISKSFKLRIGVLNVRFSPFPTKSAPRLSVSIRGFQMTVFANAKRSEDLREIIKSRLKAKIDRLNQQRQGKDFTLDSRDFASPISFSDVLSFLDLPIPTFSQTPSLPKSSLPFFYRLVAQTSIKIHHGTLLIGNNRLPNVMIGSFASVTGVHEAVSCSNSIDPYRTITKLTLLQVSFKTAQNQDYSPAPPPPHSHSSSSLSSFSAGTGDYSLETDALMRLGAFLYDHDPSLQQCVDSFTSSLLQPQDDFFTRQAEYWKKIDQTATTETIFETESMVVVYYYDAIDPDYKPEPLDDEETSDMTSLIESSAAYGVEVRFTSKVKLRYGPWTERLRQVSQRFFYPFQYDTRPLVDLNDPLTERLYLFMVASVKFDAQCSVVVPFRRMLNSVQRLSGDNPHLDSLPLSGCMSVNIGSGSSIDVLQPWYDLEDAGMISSIDCGLRNVTVTFHDVANGYGSKIPLLQSNLMDIKVGMAYPRQWNGVYKTLVDVSSPNAKINYFSDLLDVSQDLAADFSSGAPLWNLSNYFPTEYNINFRFKECTTTLNASYKNILNTRLPDLMHTKAVLKSSNLTGSVTSPMTIFKPPFITHSISLSSDSSVFSIVYPNCSPMAMFSKTSSSDIALGSLSVDGYYKGHYEILRDNVDQFVMNVSLEGVDGTVFGPEIYIGKQILANYFGWDACPITLEEFGEYNFQNKLSEDRWNRKTRWGDGSVKLFNSFESAVSLGLRHSRISVPCDALGSRQVVIGLPELSFNTHNLDGLYTSAVKAPLVTVFNQNLAGLDSGTPDLAISNLSVSLTGYYTPSPAIECYFYQMSIGVEAVTGESSLSFLMDLSDMAEQSSKIMKLPFLNDPSGKAEVPDFYNNLKMPLSLTIVNIQSVMVSISLTSTSLLSLTLADGVRYYSEAAHRFNRSSVSTVQVPDFAVKMLVPVNQSRDHSKTSVTGNMLCVVDLSLPLAFSQIYQSSFSHQDSDYNDWLKTCDVDYDRMTSIYGNDWNITSIFDPLHDLLSSPLLNTVAIDTVDDLPDSDQSDDESSIDETDILVDDFNTARGDADSLSDRSIDSLSFRTDSSMHSHQFSDFFRVFHDEYSFDLDLLKDRFKSNIYKSHSHRLYSTPTLLLSLLRQLQLHGPLLIVLHCRSELLNSLQGVDVVDRIGKSLVNYGISEYRTEQTTSDIDSNMSFKISNILLELPASAYIVDVPVVKTSAPESPTITVKNNVLFSSVSINSLSGALRKVARSGDTSVSLNLDNLVVDLSRFDQSAFVVNQLLEGLHPYCFQLKLEEVSLTTVARKNDWGLIKFDCKPVTAMISRNLYSAVLALKHVLDTKFEKFNSIRSNSEYTQISEIGESLVNELIIKDSSYALLSHPKRIRTMIQQKFINSSQTPPSNSFLDSYKFRVFVSVESIGLQLSSNDARTPATDCSFTDFKITGQISNNSLINVSLDNINLNLSPLVTIVYVALNAQLGLPSSVTTDDNDFSSDDEDGLGQYNPFEAYDLLRQKTTGSTPLTAMTSSPARMGGIHKLIVELFRSSPLNDSQKAVVRPQSITPSKSITTVKFTINQVGISLVGVNGGQTISCSSFYTTLVKTPDVTSACFSLSSVRTYFMSEEMTYDFGICMNNLKFLHTQANEVQSNQVLINSFLIDVPFMSDYWILPKLILEEFSPSSFKVPSLMTNVTRGDELQSQISSEVSAPLIRIYARHKNKLPKQWMMLLDNVSSASKVSQPTESQANFHCCYRQLHCFISFERTLFKFIITDVVFNSSTQQLNNLLLNISTIDLEFTPVVPAQLNDRNTSPCFSDLSSEPKSLSSDNGLFVAGSTDEESDGLFGEEEEVQKKMDSEYEESRITIGNDEYVVLMQNKKIYSFSRLFFTGVNTAEVLKAKVFFAPMSNTITTEMVSFMALLQTKITEEWSTYSDKISELIKTSKKYTDDAKDLLDASSAVQISKKFEILVNFTAVSLICPTPAASAAVKLSNLKISFNNTGPAAKFYFLIDKIKFQLACKNLLFMDDCSDSQSQTSYYRPSLTNGSQSAQFSDNVDATLSKNDVICMELITSISISNSDDSLTNPQPDLLFLSVSVSNTLAIVRPMTSQCLSLISSSFMRAYASVESRRVIASLPAGFSANDLQEALAGIKDRSKTAGQSWFSSKSFLVSILFDSTALVIPSALTKVKVSRDRPLSLLYTHFDSISIGGDSHPLLMASLPKLSFPSLRFS